MTLFTKGNISRYYAETLVLLFFPGSKFPEDGTGGEPIITMSVYNENGRAYGKVSIREGAKEASFEYSPDPVIPVSDEMLLKLAAGGAMMKAGREFCGTVPPWGMITGVRPAKMCLDLFDKGFDKETVYKHFCCDFLATPEKAEIALSTALRERPFVTDERRRECSVYIAIPFCPTRCAYCSFVSYSSPKLLGLIPDYLARLVLDIKSTFDIIRKMGLRVATVYVGGGTPTTLSKDQLEILLSAVCTEIDVSSLDEFTVEAGRPDTIDLQKMMVLKKHGVTRVSVNAQTLNDNILKAIGRRHTASEFLEAFECACESGISDINVDLIAGLPGEHYQSFADSVSRIVDLAPTNITVHTFYVKRAADLRDSASSYRAEDENTKKAVDIAQGTIIGAGYAPYYLYKQKNTAANLENAGFSVNGHECLYNIFMMEEIHTVFGIGASAMTKLVSPDSRNMKIKRICETKYPYEFLDSEKGSADKRYTELYSATEAFYREHF